MKITRSMIVVFFICVLMSGNSFCAGNTTYDFKDDKMGWEMPEWSCEMSDHICKSLLLSKDIPEVGDSNLKLELDFPGDGWYAAVVEKEGPFNWMEYNSLSARVYLTSDTGVPIVARFILAIGENWWWTESAMPVVLKPHAWTTIEADLKNENHNWLRDDIIKRKDKDGNVIGFVTQKVRVNVDDGFKSDIKAVAMRIEANAVEYEGAVYIDDISLS